jgi:hypothetical protein
MGPYLITADIVHKLWARQKSLGVAALDEPIGRTARPIAAFLMAERRKCSRMGCETQPALA